MNKNNQTNYSNQIFHLLSLCVRCSLVGLCFFINIERTHIEFPAHENSSSVWFVLFTEANNGNVLFLMT